MVPVKPNAIPKTVLLLAPTGYDSAIACSVLEKSGIVCLNCSTLRELCARIHDEIGAVIIAEEGLSPDQIPEFIDCLNLQPPWSDLPVIVLTIGRDQTSPIWKSGMFGPRANVTLLERPFHTATLLSVLEGALRARARQIDLKDLMKQRQQLLEMEKKARAEAEQTNRAKDEFLATLSHELRTPLTTILGWSKILSTNRLNESASTRAAAAIERSARSQAQLIDDLLDVSRIITGKFQIEKRNVDLVELIQSSVDTIRPLAEAKGLSIQYEMMENPGPILGDFHRLQQVLWNIFSNAIKFTPPGGVISVEIHSVNSHASIVVHDTGKGIDQAFLPFIFERFRQFDSSYTRNQGGLGLGLAIVQHIVNLHNGKVTAKSEGQGKGSTFVIELPVVATETRGFRSHRIKTTHGKPPAKLNGMKLLVVEDDAESRELIEVILKQGKAEVRSANSVENAFEVLEEWIPDIIISDIGLPGQDGYALIARIRSDDLLGQIPVIALTAYASSNDREKALNAGFQIHLSKPIDPAELLEIVSGLFREMN